PGNIRELENVVKRAAVLSANENLSSQDFAFFLGKSEEAAQEALEELGLEDMIESRLKGFLGQLSDVEMTDLYSTILPMAERPLLKLVLKKTGNNQIRAAKLLGINRNTLRKKIRELGIRLKEEA
ncbi:MAG: helix-turn-helix domain-containing protein, partial [bacterium]|nr:helix-turn-helix domain-containing protein [bacterium]